MGARVLIALGLLLAAAAGCASVGALDRRLAARAERPAGPPPLLEGECLRRTFDEDAGVTEKRESVSSAIAALTYRKKGRSAAEFAECRVGGRTYVFTAAGVVSISPAR